MCLSEKKQTEKITSILKDIFGGDELVKIPKIIFVDTCHGDGRNHLDVYSRTTNCTHPSNDAKAKGKSADFGGAGQQEETKETENLDNFIIIHASVQQNYSWQGVGDIPGSIFLKGLCKKTYFINNHLLLST
jgi:hypothetical protein